MTDTDRFERQLRADLIELAGSATPSPAMAERHIAAAARPAWAEAGRPRPGRGWPRRWALPLAVAAVVAAGAITVGTVRSHHPGRSPISDANGVAASSPTPPPQTSSPRPLRGFPITEAPPVTAAVPTDPGPCPTSLSRPSGGPLVSVDPNPTGLVTVWYAGMNQHAQPCTVLVRASASLAAQVARDLRAAKPVTNDVVNCDFDDGSRVTMYFTYANHAEAQVATLSLRGCSAIYAAGRTARQPGNVMDDLLPLQPTQFNNPGH